MKFVMRLILGFVLGFTLRFTAVFFAVSRGFGVLRHGGIGRGTRQKLQNRVRIARSQLRHRQNQQLNRSKLPRAEGHRADIGLHSTFPAEPTRATTELSVFAEMLAVSRGSSRDTSPVGVWEAGSVCVEVQECDSRGVTSRIRNRMHCSMN